MIDDLAKRAKEAAQAFNNLLDSVSEMRSQLPDEDKKNLTFVNELKSAIKNRDLAKAQEIQKRMENLKKIYTK